MNVNATLAARMMERLLRETPRPIDPRSMAPLAWTPSYPLFLAAARRDLLLNLEFISDSPEWRYEQVFTPLELVMTENPSTITLSFNNGRGSVLIEYAAGARQLSSGSQVILPSTLRARIAR